MNKQATIFTLKNLMTVLFIGLVGYGISKFPDQSFILIGVLAIILIGYWLVDAER